MLKPFRRRLTAYLRLVDLLDLFANLALVFITVESVNDLNGLLELPRPILYSAAAYVLLTVFRIIWSMHNRKARDHELRESVCQIFHWLYEEMFGLSPGRRFTLFVIDPLSPERIIPKVRYRPGHRELLAEFTSRASYRSGEGCTGHAWEHTGSLIFTVLPSFANRDEFTAYYINTLHVDRSTVALLSDFMVTVQGIYSFGFADHKGGLLGILSIDVQGRPEQLDLDAAEKMVRAIGAVLEAFS